MKLVDRAKIYIRSGQGGNGCVSFRREKFIEFGGPDGGNGGRGGHVFARAVDGLNTLIDFRYRPHIFASNGKHGSGRGRSGAYGKDAMIDVPCGTQITDADQETLLADLTEPNNAVLLAAGGRGGLGNACFATPTRQSPRQATRGAAGLELTLWLQLKLMADVALVGLPNVGKSTYLSVVSNARPKIADYPFTTLKPNLGVVDSNQRTIVIADIPGLIAGAHQGRGIGDRFLAHIERCSVVVHMIDATSVDCAQDYHIVKHELTLYGQGIADKPRLVVLTKADAVSTHALAAQTALLERITHHRVFALSAHSGKGQKQLLYAMQRAIDRSADLAASQTARRLSNAFEQQWSPV